VTVTLAQAPAPDDRPIERGLPTAGTIAQVVVAKYLNHMPLHRQAAHYARLGVLLATTTLYGWVEAAARDGYASSVEELEEGLNAIAVPVRDHTGGVIAALSVSGPVYRFTQERMREVTPDVVVAAAAISHRMASACRRSLRTSTGTW